MKKIFTLLFIFNVVFNANLIAQGTFDNYPLSSDGWIIIDSGITITEETAITSEGTSSASVEVTTTSQASTDLRTELDVISGTSYEICFDIYHTEGHVKARIYADTYYNYSDNSTTNAWQTICKTITPGTTETIQIGLRFYDQPLFDGNEVVYADNLTVNGVVLPVVLNGFDVNHVRTKNIISWSTSSEINNSHFNVQHSTSGYDFNSIGIVNGAGNSNRLQHYIFNHNTPIIGKNYYRLQQVDFDGALSYSDIIQESHMNRNNEIRNSIVSNKVTNRIQFQLELDNAEFTLLDINGQLIINKSINKNSSIDISLLQKGMYIAQINVNGTITSEKIIIQ